MKHIPAIPLSTQRSMLPLKAVLLHVLDGQKRPITQASGFVREDEGRLHLYTCWHVVAGFDKHDLRINSRLPVREYVSIHMQDAVTPQEGVETIGGLQTLTVPLYYDSDSGRLPAWHQDQRHIPHPDLNAIGLFVPFWHDAVRIDLPDHVRASELQVLDESDQVSSNTLLTPGDKLYIVGFPYGFSAAGPEQPFPVVLTRFVAATRMKGRPREILLESAGAPSMSGSPVFVERDSCVQLVGIYNGCVYPDYPSESPEKHNALGACSDLSLHLWKMLPFVRSPSES